MKRLRNKVKGAIKLEESFRDIRKIKGFIHTFLIDNEGTITSISVDV